MKHIWILLLFVNLVSFSQSKSSRFSKLSAPEKWWVVFHPFKAKRALDISLNAIKVTDSLYSIKTLGQDKNGGQLDAFKHSYWIARLTLKIGVKPSLKLGIAHEKGNYKTYKKGKLEEGVLPDKASSEMDLFNNDVGAQIALNNSEIVMNELIELIIYKVKAGTLRILKKDAQGNFLTCDNVIISIDTIGKNWENDKCLVLSDQINLK